MPMSTHSSSNKIQMVGLMRHPLQDFISCMNTMDSRQVLYKQHSMLCKEIMACNINNVMQIQIMACNIDIERGHWEHDMEKQ